jgi:hypothetical protein
MKMKIEFNTIEVNTASFTQIEDLIMEVFEVFFDIRNDQRMLGSLARLYKVEKRELTSLEAKMIEDWESSSYSPLFDKKISTVVLTALCNAGFIPEGYLLVNGES